MSAVACIGDRSAGGVDLLDGELDRLHVLRADVGQRSGQGQHRAERDGTSTRRVAAPGHQ
jgi:hypothetical protein